MRALTYAGLFIAFVLVFLPARLLEWSGVNRPSAAGPAEIAGAGLAVTGGVLALWCVVTFALVGRGTPAPFDPPRRLVVRGPYRIVRNPMYLGAGLALAGAALFYRSAILAGYVVLFLLIAHGFVRLYEEPMLRRLFGTEYQSYFRAVPRWFPRPAPKVSPHLDKR